MLRLFLLSMAFTIALLLIGLGIAAVIEGDVVILVGIFFLIIGGTGTITLGVMLVKHIMDIFKKGT